MLRFSGTFQFIVNIIPQNLIKVCKYLHAFLPGIYKIHTFSSYNSKNIEGGSELSKQKSIVFLLTFHSPFNYLCIRHEGNTLQTDAA